jgi:hypothetical protein
MAKKQINHFLKSALKEWANTVPKLKSLERFPSAGFWKQKQVRELRERENLNSDI